MRKSGLLILFILVTMLILPIGVFAKEYFLFDLEENKILVMENKDNEFTAKISLDKKPDLMMQTHDPNKFLAIYLPETEKNEDGKIINYGQAGEMILFDVTTGRTEDLLELGYPPFNWAYTQDKKDFFITFHPEPSDQVELFHYNIPEMKVEKLYGIASSVNDMVVSLDGKTLNILTGAAEKRSPQLLTLSCAPLGVLASLPVGKNPEKIYMLSQDRAAILDVDSSDSHKSGESSIKLINTADNTLVEERRFKPTEIRLQWFEKEKTIVVAVDEKQSSPRKSKVFKVNAAGFRYYEIPTNWIDLSYLPDLDCLYVLTTEDLKKIDYGNSSIRSFATDGPNNSPGNYQFYRLPNSNTAIIYCFKNGMLKFFDISKNTVLSKVIFGRSGVKILNSLTFGSKDTDTVVTTNAQISRFYILNRSTRDVTVFDNSFKRISYIVPPEPPLAMYQIQKPYLSTIIITEKKIYKIDEEKLLLKPIYEFKSKSGSAYLQEEEGRIIFISDREFLILDPATLEVKDCFYLYGNPDEKFSKLKPDEQRYYFIPTL